jgi:hypothetical protein
MVLSYDYSSQIRRRWRKNAPPSRAISMAMAVRPCNTECISLLKHNQGFTGSHRTLPSGDYSLHITPEAARATINTTIMQNVPTLLTISMAIAVRRYYTTHIPRWRGSVAFIKATKRHHRASTRSDIIKRDIAMPRIHYLLRVSGAGDGAIELDG